MPAVSPRLEQSLRVGALMALVIAITACRRTADQPALEGPMSGWKIADRWSIGKGEQDGKPIFTRFNLGLKPLVGRPEFRQQLGISVRLKDPTPDGLPTSAEAEQLSQIEDEIVRRFVPGNESLFAGVMTFNGMREYVLYTNDPKAASAKATDLVRDIHHHELQFAIHDDPSWANFKKFAAGA